MTSKELDDKWFDFTCSFVSKLIEHKNNWDMLSEDEQELAALWKLEMDMYNGGFIQFFCNWGYDCYLHAIRSLTKLNAMQALNIVQKEYDIIKHLEGDERLKAYWDIPKYLTPEESEILNNLDEEYWDNADHIMEKTFEVYKDTKPYEPKNKKA